jgi:hypothetical protein
MGRTKAQNRTKKARTSLASKRPLEASEYDNPSLPKKAKNTSVKVNYCQQKDPHKIRKDTWDFIQKIAGSKEDGEALVLDIIRVYCSDLNDKLILSSTIEQNISTAFSKFSRELGGSLLGSSLATVLTSHLSLEKASNLTGYSISTLLHRKQSLSDSNEVNFSIPVPLPAIEDIVPPVKSVISLDELFPNPTNIPLSPPHIGPIIPPIENLIDSQVQKTSQGKYIHKVHHKTPNGNTYIERPAIFNSGYWNWYIDWLWTVAPLGDSNNPNQMLTWNTWKGAHTAFQSAAASEGFKPKGYNWFKQWTKKQNVKLGKFDRYRCEQCCKGLEAKSKKIPTQEDLTEIASYQSHVQLYKTQFELYSQQLQNLPPSKVFIVFDYSTVHETAKFKLKDLNFTAFWTDEKGQHHTYFDFWGTGKKDFNFTVKSFYHLIDLQFFRQFNECILWADGGLKTNAIVHYFSAIAAEQNLPIQINYFAPHHGHSVCDAHFGQGKRALRKVVGVEVVKDQEQVMDAFSALSNTAQGTFLTMEEEGLYPVTTNGLIRKYFQFYIQKTGNIYCRETWKSKWETQTSKVQAPKAKETLKLNRNKYPGIS